MLIMSEHHVIIHRWKVVSVIQTVLIAFLIGLILYLIQFVRQGSTVTLTPTLTSSAHATTLPNATSTPSLDMQVPPTKNTKIQPAFDRV